MALGRTLLTQTAKINVTAFPLLNSLLERIWVGQYESTVSKVSMTTCICISLSLYLSPTCIHDLFIAMQGREGIEFVANKIIEEQKSV